MKKIFDFLGITRLINFFKPTLLGDDNQASYKRVSMFIILTLYVLGDAHMFYTVDDAEMKFKLQCLNVIFFLLIAGIVTIQQLTTLFNTTKNGVINKDDVESIEKVVDEVK